MEVTSNRMKELLDLRINGLLGRWGYLLLKTNRYHDALRKGNWFSFKYKELIKEIEHVYRNPLGLAFPPSDDRRFDLLAGLIGTQIPEALHLLHYLHKASMLPGDVCEFGVAEGATSALLANEVQLSDKTLWLFDSFQGLPKPTEKDKLKDDIFGLGSMEAYAGKMSWPIESVRRKLQESGLPFSRIQLVPGFIEETIKGPHLPDQVCFAYLDFDFYEPTAIVLAFLDQVLPKNGIAFVDDFDWFSTGIRAAVEEFIACHPGRYHATFDERGHFCVLEKVV